MHQPSLHSRLEWSGSSHLSFYITLQLVLHFSEFAPDETLQAVTLSAVEVDHFSAPCSVPVLCLIYCTSVLTDIFCSNARQPLLNNAPSHFLCVLVGWCGGKSYLLENNGALACAEIADCEAVECHLISFSVTIIDGIKTTTHLSYFTFTAHYLRLRLSCCNQSVGRQGSYSSNFLWHYLPVEIHMVVAADNLKHI